jgi:hypothetical protein
MLKQISNILINTVIVVTSLLMADACQALPISSSRINQATDGFLNPINPSQNNNSIEQITNVSELRDVGPTDWAYQALRGLVDRYGCIVGYPNQTFRGNNSLSRWEFAAGLNACLNALQSYLGEMSKEELEKLQRLSQEFASELTALGGKIDNLQSRVAFLEEHQFSTTTKLEGQVVLGLSGIAGGEKEDGTAQIPQAPTLGYRARLQLNTSFTGKDLLYTRLATGNISEFTEVAGTTQANLAFAQPDNSQLAVEVLNYRFPISENISLWLEGAGGAFDDFTNTLNILDGDGASGALSVFGTRAPIYYSGVGSGVGFQGQFGAIQWSLGYLAPFGNDPTPGNGMFNGAFALLAQVGYVPGEDFGVAFTYNHGYNTLNLGTGSRRQANFRSILADVDNTLRDSYNLGFSWRIGDNFVLGGWGGFSNVRLLGDAELPQVGTLSPGEADFWNWAVTLAFPDVFKEGSMAGIIVGMQPWVTSSTIVADDDIPLREQGSVHLEAFYQYPINDNISLTPGIIVITSPDGTSLNSPIVIGVIRTTFSF